MSKKEVGINVQEVFDSYNQKAAEMQETVGAALCAVVIVVHEGGILNMSQGNPLTATLATTQIAGALLNATQNVLDGAGLLERGMLLKDAYSEMLAHNTDNMNGKVVKVVDAGTDQEKAETFGLGAQH